MTKSYFAIIAATCAIAIPAAHATVISDGQCSGLNCASSLSNFSGALGTRLASLTAAVSSPAAPAIPWTGTFRTAVFRNVGGTLDFYYQFTNNLSSLDTITRITNSTFAGFTTDVGYRADLPSELSTLGWITGSPQDPSYVNRTNGGTVVGFNFFNPLSASAVINPGETSRILVIRTDAFNYTTGITGIIDGSTTNTMSWAPTAAPEPASLGMMGAGLLALASLRKRFSL